MILNIVFSCVFNEIYSGNEMPSGAPFSGSLSCILLQNRQLLTGRSMQLPPITIYRFHRTAFLSCYMSKTLNYPKPPFG